jgi:hypothetical protein
MGKPKPTLFSLMPPGSCRGVVTLKFQYEKLFNPNISTFHVSVMANTPATASHKAFHPSWRRFSAFMPMSQQYGLDKKLYGCFATAVESLDASSLISRLTD